MHKVESGAKLVILGVLVEPSMEGVRCRPSPDKVIKWIAMIDEIIAKGREKARCFPGAASKLAGRLSWAASALFNRFGRAMLRAIFDQCSRYDGRINFELWRALIWWRRVLATEIAELRPWVVSQEKPWHLFCDASGEPPRLGAVLLTSAGAFWTCFTPGQSFLDNFKCRSDNQIMALELLAISLGIHTFLEKLKGRKIVIHCDNSGSECSLRKGSAKCADHAQLVHELWSDFVCHGIKAFVVRVTTKMNIADNPSRWCAEDDADNAVDILRHAGAEYVEGNVLLACCHVTVRLLLKVYYHQNSQRLMFGKCCMRD